MSSPSTSSLQKQDIDNEKIPDLGYGEQDASAKHAILYDNSEFAIKTTRKVDWRLVPIVAALYSMALIDRSNLGLIRVTGMDQALGLSVGARYSIIACIFFVPYTLLEIPMNIYIRKVSPRAYLGGTIFLWGICTMASGFVKTWVQLFIIRILIGILEAGFLPCCAYLISTWYPRHEVHVRLAWFYAVSFIVGGFSPILTYGLTFMGGLSGLAAWQWIWIIEGLMSIALAIISYFLIVDFPDQNRFLTQEETAWVLKRINVDRADAEVDVITKEKFFKYLKDWKPWHFGICFGTATYSGYAISFFLPEILVSMNFSVSKSQLLCCPPFVSGALWGVLEGYIADRTLLRAPWLLLNCLLGIIGYALIAYCTTFGARYAGVFLVLAGACANCPAMLAYQANNIVGQSKKAFASAMTISWAGIGGILAAVTYREQDAPKYLPGFDTTMASQGLMFVMICFSTWKFYVDNKAAKAGEKINEEREGFQYTL